MNTRRSHFFLLFLTLIVLSVFIGQTWAQAGEKNSTFEILVRFKKTVSSDQRSALSVRFGATPLHYNRNFDVHVLQFSKADGKVSIDKVLQELRKDPNIEWAEPNYMRYPLEVPNDPQFPQQWHLRNTGQGGGTPGADIHAEAAWDITKGDAQVVIAVLDTGVDYSHPDLQENMWHNAGENPNNGLDDDGNGYIDDYYGIDCITNSGDPTDQVGHGTHVAGIIGAVSNNAVGVSGINWRVSLMALKFMGSEGGTVADELKCISYILDQKSKGVPIRVVNASFGSSEASYFEEEAIAKLEEAGIILSAAAGNDGRQIGKSYHNYPAEYGLLNIISVAASDNMDRLASFSNYGLHSVDLAAPGVGILSSYLHGNYKSESGTSMAAPQVSGAIGLLMAAFNPSPLEARERILRGVEANNYLYGKVFSNGRLDVYGALKVELTGPYIFDISSTGGSAGTQVTLKGARFGNVVTPANNVTFGNKNAAIVSWVDDKIVCQVPSDINTDNGQTEIAVHNAAGDSNAVWFEIFPYRYFLPFAPAGAPWQTFLLLCNSSLETVSASVFAGPSGAWEIKPRIQALAPYEVIYINLQAYGLGDDKNILWVESPRDIGVDLVVFNIEGALSSKMAFVPSQRR